MTPSPSAGRLAPVYSWPLRVALVERTDGPVWFGAGGGDLKFYYRARHPAAALGGTIHDALTYQFPGDAPDVRRQVQCDDAAGIARLADTRQPVTLFGIGPLVVLQPPFMYPTDAWAGIVQALQAAGVRVWVDADDDDLATPWHEWLTDGRSMGLLRPAAPDDDDAIWHHRAACRRMWWDALAAADGVIIATPALREVVAPYCGRVHLVEPAIDLALFPADAGQRPDDGTVRIGYAGDWFHQRDFDLAWPALQTAAERPDTEVHLFGHHKAAAPAVVHPWQPLRAFYAAVGLLDIAVLPLRDTPRNRGSASTKWRELAAHGIAMVATDLPPVAGMTDGTHCLKVPPGGDFTAPLLRLIEDAPLCRRLGAAARALVLTHHTTTARAPAWQAWYHEALADA
jgi:hypothetical protein